MTSPKTDAELAAAYREMVNHLCGWLTPENLPLTPEHQARFIQSALWYAKGIHDSEPFLRGEVIQAAAKLTTLTKRPRP